MSFSEFIGSLTGDKKKFINIIIALLAGILLLTMGGGLFPQSKPPPKAAESGVFDVTSLEKRLEGILSQIKGVGDVSVMITLDDSETKVVATDDKNTANGSSSYEKRNVLLDNGKQPLVVKMVMPNVKGVIVTAKGTADPEVKSNIEQAVIAVLAAPAHRVQVFEKK